jgi:hypothetical protein
MPDEDFFGEDEPVATTEEDYLTGEDSSDIFDSLALIKDPEAQDNEEIIYLTDDTDTSVSTEEGDDDRTYIYFDNDLYKEIKSIKHLGMKYRIVENTPIPTIGDDYSIINFDSEDPDRVIADSDFDLLSREIDESLDDEQNSQSFRARIVTITAASFSAGFVSYLLRVGSMFSSLMSTLPLWRGFDPIAVFIGDKKKKKNRNNTTDTDKSKQESLFDGESE